MPASAQAMKIVVGSTANACGGGDVQSASTPGTPAGRVVAVVDVACVVVVGVDVVVDVTFVEVGAVVVVVGDASGISPPQPQSSTAVAPMTSPSNSRLRT